MNKNERILASSIDVVYSFDRSVDFVFFFSFAFVSSAQVHFASHFQMEDTTRLTSEPSIKLFIQRDYSEGTAVKFQERFPSELQGKVTLSKQTEERR